MENSKHSLVDGGCKNCTTMDIGSQRNLNIGLLLAAYKLFWGEKIQSRFLLRDTIYILNPHILEIANAI